MLLPWTILHARQAGAIAPLIGSDPELMHLLSRNFAKRNLRRQEKTAASVQGSHEEEQARLAAFPFGKMSGIFRSGRVA